MKRFYYQLRIMILTLGLGLTSVPCLAQIRNNHKPKTNKPNATKAKPSPALSDEEKREQEETDQMEKEASYYAPIRYVIVYNWIFDELDLPERRMDILIDSKQFNQKNLTAVFELVKKRFPTPLRLMIDVHTNLATIETPEEFEIGRDSEDTRFGNKKFEHRNAFYMRYEDGSDEFIYTTKLKPYYDDKNVDLESKKPQ